MGFLWGKFLKQFLTVFDFSLYWIITTFFFYTRHSFNSCETRRRCFRVDRKHLFLRSTNNRTSGRYVTSFCEPARFKDLVGTLDLPQRSRAQMTVIKASRQLKTHKRRDEKRETMVLFKWREKTSMTWESWTHHTAGLRRFKPFPLNVQWWQF